MCQFLDGKDEDGFISSYCPVTVELIQKYCPTLLDKLIPIQSSNVCTALYARKYLHDENPFGVISLCIVRTAEVSECYEDVNIAYHVTLPHFIESLKEGDLDRQNEKATIASEDLGYLYAIRGGLRENIGFSRAIMHAFSIWMVSAGTLPLSAICS